jgi:ubiquinol-cytochrome c reductase cytochrome b subunit
VKDFFGFGFYFLIFAFFIFYAPNYLGHPDNYIPANPLVTPPHIVPEWYFLPFYAILRAVPAKLGGVALMFGAILILFFLPWLDYSEAKSIRYRPDWHKYLYGVFVINFLVLGYLGVQPVSSLGERLSQIGTVIYFGFFLLMPWWSRLGTFKTVPDRVTFAAH